VTGVPSPGWDPDDLLDVRDLSVRFSDGQGSVTALDGLSLVLRRGETVGIVGESGAGKTVTVRAIMGLLPPAASVSGSVRLWGTELVGLPERRFRRYRGTEMGMVFQEASRSLNPTIRIGQQIAEAVRVHQSISRRAAGERAVELLERVGVAEPAARARDLPYRLAPLVRQKALVAMAIACGPKLLIADEAGSSLDRSERAQMSSLLQELQHELEMAMILVSHDVGPELTEADRVLTLCGGQVLERASGATLKTGPRVPYTRLLLNSSAVLTRKAPPPPTPQAPVRPPRMFSRRMPLRSLAPTTRPARPQVRSESPLGVGCAFASRCPNSQAHCREAMPPLKEYEYGHEWACWFPLNPPATSSDA
jgi:ABC-type dipeptide/oligopeptide/nickel transport system ATPase component